MSTFNDSDHPRVTNGTFTDKAQSAPESAVALAPRPMSFGQYPVNLEGFPPVANYRFQASAIVEAPGGLVPYFTELEMTRVIEPINATELESDDPQVIVNTPSGFAVSAHGALHPLPRIDTPTGPLYACDDDAGTREWELTEGEWFADGGTDRNFTEMHTERAEAANGDTFDRSWTMRRDDGKFVTRTATFFVEAYEDDASEAEELVFDRSELEGETVTTFSVLCRTEDSIAETLNGDREPLEDPNNEDHLETDRVFDDLASAEAFARARANGAEAHFHVAGWDGHRG
jgi:hypothetical protein